MFLVLKVRVLDCLASTVPIPWAAGFAFVSGVVVAAYGWSFLLLLHRPKRKNEIHAELRTSTT